MNKISDKEIKQIKKEIKSVCQDSIDSTLKYPIFRDSDDFHQIRNDFKDKIVLIIYDNNNKPIATNIMISFGGSFYHTGLYLINKNNKREDIMKILEKINIIPLFLYGTLNLIITNIDSCPNRYYSLKRNSIEVYPELEDNKSLSDFKNQYYTGMAKKVLLRYSDQIGVNKNYSFNSEKMIIYNSYDNSDGDMRQLTNKINGRKNEKIDNYFEKNLGSGDELFSIFHINLFHFILRNRKIAKIFNLILFFLLFLKLFTSALMWNIPCILFNQSINYLTRKVANASKISFKENKSDVTQSKLILSNHYNFFDTYASCDIKIEKDIKFVIKSDLTGEIKYLKFFDNLMFNNYSFIKYKRGDENSGIKVKKRILDSIKDNYNILIFPEGTSHHDGKTKDIKPGILKLILENKLDIDILRLDYFDNIGIEKGDNILNILKFTLLFMRECRYEREFIKFDDKYGQIDFDDYKKFIISKLRNE